jgi:hypothetical protein
LYGHRRPNPSSSPLPTGGQALQKGGISPSLAKRGQGRFSQQYVFSIMDSFVIFGKAIERYLPA